MKTVCRALTLMADSVHYFSHNVAFFFFFLSGTTCTKTQSHIHLQPTFLQPGKTFHKSTPSSEHPKVIPVSPPSRFSYPGLVTLSSACSSIKWTYSKQRGKTGNITKYVCLSDNNRSIRLRTAHTVGLEAVVTTFCPTQNDLNNTNKKFFGWKLLRDGAPRITCFSLESPYRSAFSLDRLVLSHYRWRTTGISKLHWT